MDWVILHLVMDMLLQLISYNITAIITIIRKISQKSRWMRKFMVLPTQTVRFWTGLEAKNHSFLTEARIQRVDMVMSSLLISCNIRISITNTTIIFTETSVRSKLMKMFKISPTLMLKDYHGQELLKLIMWMGSQTQNLATDMLLQLAFSPLIIEIMISLRSKLMKKSKVLLTHWPSILTGIEAKNHSFLMEARTQKVDMATLPQSSDI